MNAAFAAHTALFDCAVIDVLAGSRADRLGLVAQEEPRTVVARFTLTLCPPVVQQLLEQTVTQRQDTPLAALAIAYAQLHTGSINVTGFQIPCFRDTTPARIDRHRERPLARRVRRGQDRFQLAA